MITEKNLNVRKHVDIFLFVMQHPVVEILSHRHNVWLMALNLET